MCTLFKMSQINLDIENDRCLFFLAKTRFPKFAKFEESKMTKHAMEKKTVHCQIL